jgi:hypothetical protein
MSQVEQLQGSGQTAYSVASDQTPVSGAQYRATGGVFPFGGVGFSGTMGTKPPNASLVGVG